uniref:Cilia- and flagella-associated protein 206 n=1 Tax=Globisporangium ultimum (strain ATCC 200006 / CBS 805.95 / DAOM BR144) TaxID=431595 RepID=K3W6Q8_GLOUD
MRRHYLFHEEEHENGVGDGMSNLLRLWLGRRTEIMQHEQVARYLVFFWDLAKEKSQATLSASRYDEFFARVAKSLVQSINTEGAPVVAPRDWVYDSEARDVMTLELFREALMQVAELVLPVESEHSMFVSFFLELRESVAMVDGHISGLLASESDSEIARSDSGPASEEPAIDLTLKSSLSSPQLYEAVSYVLRPLRDVTKIRGAFVQKMPPGLDQIKTVSGLAPPNSQQMSLKQLLLCYNPRKFALSRKFSALFRGNGGKNNQQSEDFDEATDPRMQMHESDPDDACKAALAAASAPTSSRILNKESEDDWDAEIATINSLEEFPAFRVAVVGPPHAGKTRVSKMLARKLKLRYVSIGTALEEAIQRKNARAALRTAALSSEIKGEEEPVAPNDTATTQPSEESEPTESEQRSEEVGDNAELVAESPVMVEVTKVPEPIHEEDLLFSDADLDTLFSGSALSRSKCLEIFTYYVKKSLLEGVGVVMDDIHPGEIETEIGTDYLVVLSAPRDDIQMQMQQFTLAPSARRLYSARERAILAGDPISVEALGFADSVRRQDESAADDGSDISSKKDEIKLEADASNDQEAEEEREEVADADGEQVETTPPPELSQIERNEVEDPGEPTLPVCTLLLESFPDRYKDYKVRVQTRLEALANDLPNTPKQRYHLIHNSMGISRTNVSRRAIPVPLPGDITSTDRVEQIRWLLHGDWSVLNTSVEDGSIQTSGDDIFSQLPSKIDRRQLSRWKEFCPVTSTPESGLMLGNPSFTALFSGRVYLAATQEARDAFISRPLQYLRRKPQAKPFNRIWLVSSISLVPYHPAVEDRFGLTVIDAIDFLAKRTPISVEMEMMGGKTLSSTQAAELLTDAIHHHEVSSAGERKWMISNLVFSNEAIAVLKERECLPEAIVFVDPSQDMLEKVAKDTGLGGIVHLKHQELQASFASATEMMKEVGMAVRVSTLSGDIADTIETLQRELDPLAPRIDRVQDGYLKTEDAATVFAPPAALEDGETSEEPIQLRAEQGETSHFCPVSWKEKHILIPGNPEFVTAFDMRYYSFASKVEQSAFERNPKKYIPMASTATSSLIPTIVMLGVRGAGLPQLASSLQTRINKSTKVLDIDLKQINQSLANRLRMESLKAEANQTSLTDLYAEELKQELCSAMDACRGIIEDASTPTSAACIVLGGLGEDDSRLPSPELLQVCFQQDVFPVVVIPTELAEEQAVQIQLSQWRRNLPPRKTKLRRTRAADDEASESQDIDGEEEELEFNLGDAEAEEMQRLREQYAADQEALTAAINSFQARGITVAPSVDVSGSFRHNVSKFAAEIEAFMARKDSLFDRCDLLDRETLIQSLASGEVIVGKYGTSCPVEGKPINAFEIAVRYRGRVYFPHNQKAQALFASNPSRYVGSCSFAPPLQPTCCIAGAPCAGKTRFANELCAKYNLVYVSPRAAGEWVLQCHGGTALYQKVRVAQAAGASPNASTLDEAIATRLQSSECQLNGWVLDDYVPHLEDLKQSKGARASIIPGLLFILDGNFRTVWEYKKQATFKAVATQNSERDASETEQVLRVELSASQDHFIQQLSAWQKQRLDLLDFWSMQFGSFHVRQINATKTSFWNVLAQAKEKLDDHIEKIRQYRKDVVAGRPARLLGVVRSVDTLRERWHPVFQTFCPVELSSSRYSLSSTTSREFCLEFEGIHYWMASAAHAHQFVECPSEFIDPSQEESALALIPKAPVDASLLSLLSVADCEFPEMKGYCPVTFKLGTGAKDWAAIVKGQVFYRSSYLHKVYFFASEEMRRKFLAEPKLYASQRLPVKLPPELSTALSKNYPGKMEQELSAVLNEALLVLGSERPKFIQASVEASACFYLGIILKTRAKNLPSHVKTKFQAKKHAFELDCRLSELLKAAITPSNASCGTAIKGVRAVREMATTAESL